jgi:hypothetical protein
MAITNSLLTTTSVAITPSASEVDNKEIAVTSLFFCNLNNRNLLDDTAGREFINVHIVKSGATTTDTNKIIHELPIDASDTFTFNTERLILSSGDRIFASSTTNNIVSVTISYIKI